MSDTINIYSHVPEFLREIPSLLCKLPNFIGFPLLTIAAWVYIFVMRVFLVYGWIHFNRGFCRRNFFGRIIPVFHGITWLYKPFHFMLPLLRLFLAYSTFQSLDRSIHLQLYYQAWKFVVVCPIVDFWKICPSNITHLWGKYKFQFHQSYERFSGIEYFCGGQNSHKFRILTLAYHLFRFQTLRRAMEALQNTHLNEYSTFLDTSST